MRRIARYAAILICVSLLIGVSTASEHNSSEGVIESSEHSFEFETVEASNTSEEFDYEVNEGLVEMEGVVQMPTPCHELDANLSSGEEEQSFEFEIDAVDNSTEESNSTDSGNETNSTDEEVCPQVIDYQGFEADLEASMPYNVTISFNGDEVETVSVNESGSAAEDPGSEGNETQGTETDVNETDSESDIVNNTDTNETDDEVNETETDDSVNETSVNETDVNETDSPDQNASEQEPDAVIESEPEDDETSDLNESESTNESEAGNDSIQTESSEQDLADSGPETGEENSGLQGTVSSVISFIGSLIPGR